MATTAATALWGFLLGSSLLKARHHGWIGGSTSF
jgi:hypothetical protein